MCKKMKKIYILLILFVVLLTGCRIPEENPQDNPNNENGEKVPSSNPEEEQNLPKNENILHEMSINDKTYEATFFLKEEMEIIMCPYFYNNVKLKIFQEDNEKYRIVLYYNHLRNFPKGEDL